ncbi:unnamed protein product [Urochloa decumbens]|uniref:F-box domain-containing protein n=1 Tax=Urochloa decumbens TaxID=240449 RepID=A0ABC8Y896_9POAL
MDSAGDIDRISALPDDLLHAILAGVGEATAVTRTAVLSKRWRRVWIHAHRLQLEDTKVSRAATPAHCRFAGFVDWVFACRGDAGIGSLEITMSRQHGCCASPERVSEWLRYAMRRVVRSFTAAKYEALTELELSKALFISEEAPGGGCTLGDFVSSCCPRLRKLEVWSPRGLPELVIRSETLEELKLFNAKALNMLDVAAPSLRVLKLDHCFHGTQSFVGFDGSAHVGTKKLARIAAPTPRLEEIAIHHVPGCRRPRLEIHDMANVRRLSNVHLYMHGPYCSVDDNLRQLEKCPGVEHIGVSLVHGTNGGRLVDLTIEGAAPFANVRSMVVEAPLFSGGELVSSISSLLSRCALLRSLSVRITEATEGLRSGAKCFCDEVDAWKFHQKLFLGSLEEVTIRGFVGADEDMELLTLLFGSSSSIRRVTIHITKEAPSFVCLKRMMAEDDEDDTKTDTKLMNIPCTDGGCWHFGEEVYTWTCNATVVHGDAN